MNDQDYFEPAKIEHGTQEYRTKLNALFEIDCLAENQFAFLILPSFEPESVLIIDKTSDEYIFKYKIFEDSFWAKFYKTNEISPKIKTYNLKVENSYYNEILNLFKVTIAEAKIPINESWVLDGVQYFLLMNEGRKIKTVFKHSPPENSKSDKIIRIFLQVIENIKNNKETN